MKEYIFDKFVDNILKHTGLTKNQLFENTKQAMVVEARKILYYLCKERGIKDTALKSYMAKNGYTLHDGSITFARHSLEKIISNDPDYIIIINKLKEID